MKINSSLPVPYCFGNFDRVASIFEMKFRDILKVFQDISVTNKYRINADEKHRDDTDISLIQPFHRHAKREGK